jgi:amino acid permease
MATQDYEKNRAPAQDIEKRSFEESSANQDGDGGHMHRALKGRQVSMIAIAGTIGTGLFLGSGGALAKGGPVGAVLGYLIVGGLVGAMMYSLGEVCICIALLCNPESDNIFR